MSEKKKKENNQKKFDVQKRFIDLCVRKASVVYTFYVFCVKSL